MRRVGYLRVFCSTIRPKRTWLWSYLDKFGRPVSFYTDKANIFQTAEKHKRDEPGVEKDALYRKLSARPAGKPEYSLVKENLRRCLSRHSFSSNAKNHTEAPVCVFKAWRNLYGP